MKVVVIGGNGQLGSDVVRAFVANGDEVCPLSHEDIEVTNIDSVSTNLTHLRPRLVINTAAMHRVESCEREPDKAFAVNALGARNLATVARQVGSILMHVSTDYVVDGTKASPYVEQDSPRPLNVYGNSKLAGEYFIRSTMEEYFILRTSAVYGASPCRGKGGLNFVELMLKIAKERGEVRVVHSEFVTPTSTVEIAKQMVLLSRTDSFDLYHASAEGACSWYEFAREIFGMTNTSVNLQVASPDEFPTKVPRPKYSILDNHALRSRGLNVFKDWRDGLRDYLEQRAR